MTYYKKRVGGLRSRCKLDSSLLCRVWVLPMQDLPTKRYSSSSHSAKQASELCLFSSHWTYLSSSFFLTRGNYWFGSYCETHLPLQIYTLTFWFPNHFSCVWVCLAWICAPKFSHLWVSWLMEILDLQRGENIIPVSPPTPCPVSSLLPTFWHLWAAMPHRERPLTMELSVFKDTSWSWHASKCIFRL